MILKSAIVFRNRLLLWYQKNHRILPWRQTYDPYKIWISEIMLQQTTVATVIPYFERWIELFPTIKDVAEASLPKILKIWQGLGYYQRARNIHKTAQIICGSYGTKFPGDYEILRRLPGFGPYTTGAVLSIAFDKPYPIVDANVRRVVMRLLAIKGYSDIKKDKPVYDFLDKVLPQRKVGIFNQALMELGALVCQPRNPLCNICPVCGHCRANKKGWQDIIPKKESKNFENIKAVVGIIENKGRFFIQQRPEKGLLAGLWEFPGGKIEKGETTKEALLRELKEELGVLIVSVENLAVIKHAYTKFKVELHVMKCQTQPLPSKDESHKWIRLEEFKKYPMPSANAKIVEKLKPCKREALV